MWLNDLLAALGVVINGIPAILLAMTYGFLAFPTALGYLVGMGACLALNSALPISMQAETIVLAGSMGKDIRERLSIVFFSGCIMMVLGLTGVLTSAFQGTQGTDTLLAGVPLAVTAATDPFIGLLSGIIL